LKLKNATLYFNHWRKASTVNRWMIRFGMLRSKQETLYKRESYLHSKFIIFEMPDGHKTAITGSHNFMMASGLVGTREIALETSDPEIISQLEQFRHDHVE
jgi:cardiolipin synthase